MKFPYKRLASLDIETIGTPEVSGYDLIVPNYSVVLVPDELTSDMSWLYISIPVQQQIDVGLKLDQGGMDFWFNNCQQEFPKAAEAMKKSLSRTSTLIIENGKVSKYNNDVIKSLNTFLYRDIENSTDVKIFGNGDHFDCSILQANHRLQYGDSPLWHYSSPNNLRTLRLLMTESDEVDMKNAILPHLNEFIKKVEEYKDILGELELHHPTFDAAKEALMIRYMIDKFSK